MQNLSAVHTAPPPRWTPTRAAGLAHLAAWIDRAGPDYARMRNFDLGAAEHTHVSTLSPWLRHRLIQEGEVLDAVLTRHSATEADSFISEIFWRGYFKGWLEQHPTVWRAYVADRDRAARELADDPKLAAARSGRTGIDAFDHWIEELLNTGYLHNHARMWCASIWIFTLRLPWQLGADLFLRHLLDGDPASNTLSWRWVAGLHTNKRAYVAEAENIARFTRGRFRPAGQLVRDAVPLTEDRTHPRTDLPRGDAAPATGRIGLLLTAEDLHPESLPLSAPPVSVMALHMADRRGDVARSFTAAALQDAQRRATDHWAIPPHPPAHSGWSTALREWIQAEALDAVVVARAPQGPVRDALDAALHGVPVPVAQLLRRHDALTWPLAGAGYFKLRKKIPDLLVGLGHTGPQDQG